MLKLIAAPLAMIYGLVVKTRNLLFDLKFFRSIPVNRATICVGNLTVGGTGKTPHVEFLIRVLSPKYRVALLSRGYKRKTKGFRIVEVHSTATEVGDEPLQIKTKFPEVLVAVDGNRVRGANAIIHHQPDTEIIILDDAFQHRWIKPGYSIVLTDFNNMITKDFFLPLGRLRDSLSELHRADCVVVSKCPKTIKPIEKRLIIKDLNLFPYQAIFFSSISYGSPLPIFKGDFPAIEFNSKLKVLAFAGVANPLPFFDYVKSNYDVVDCIAFPDHHRYSEKNIKAIFESFSKITSQHKAILTTEKDAARLRAMEGMEGFQKDIFHFIPIEVIFDIDTEQQFINQIEGYVRKSKRNSNLYKEQG
ncbi:MAG TPA: tetraacyldisaccharide 4'-kinase [Tenuifilaceae bacterium]|nr:tetraacyldisaccharide 4'-kinase [Tenuifilaceae bacterium]